ncbi:MAG: hypothetical protein ACUVX9_17910 [Anaerolineae bacterium]
MTKRILACCAVAFSVVLAVIVGNRMSAEAMAVVIGVVCGVAAGVPVSAIILAVNRRPLPSTAWQAEVRPSTSVYLLPTGQVAPYRSAPDWSAYCPPYPAVAAPPAPPREFRIIGEETWPNGERT